MDFTIKITRNEDRPANHAILIFNPKSAKLHFFLLFLFSQAIFSLLAPWSCSNMGFSTSSQYSIKHFHPKN